MTNETFKKSDILEKRRMKGDEEKKQKILKVLKKFKKLSTSQVGAICGITYRYAKPLLEQLKKEGKIKEEKAGELASYWELK